MVASVKHLWQPDPLIVQMRKLFTSVMTLAGLLTAGFAESASPPATFLDGAQWIWYSQEPMPISQSFPADANYFRGSLVVPDAALVQSAGLVITADNLFWLNINGKIAGEGHTDPGLWNSPKRFDVKGLLVPGRNVVAVEAANTAAGPAGLILKMVVRLADGSELPLVTDATWKCTDNEAADWQKPEFSDERWSAAHVVGNHGIPPWGRLQVPQAAEPASPVLTEARVRARKTLDYLRAAAKAGGVPAGRPVMYVDPPANYAWPEGVVFLSDDCSLYRPSNQSGGSYDSLSVTTFNPRHSRAFPEHDLPAPIKVGRKLFALRPARPGTRPELLLDAGRGGIGSPSVSFDGRWIYVSMARDTEPFFHLYRVPAAGGSPERLTDGPFHDIDPAELPDGRLVFTSTRAGTFEEYHNPPSRALFLMPAAGGEIVQLTHTFIFDNEPEVMADGRILFIRSDNFFDRGKVETLLHAVHPDGTTGYTEFGLDLGPDYGGRLRAYNCGSPAPMPDGRVAFVTGSSIAVARPGAAGEGIRHLGVEAGDVAALPDGRLLCTLLPGTIPGKKTARAKRTNRPDSSFERIGIMDPQNPQDEVVLLYEDPGQPLHSPVFLGARHKPPTLVAKVEPQAAPGGTGILYCQNARLTRNTTAGWPHVRAMRVLAGKGLTLRSSHSYIVHAGSEVIELGTVPLAPDGSFSVEVPADTAIAFQAVDAEGRSELNEMSWIFVRAGEKRGCVGCHHGRQASPHATGAPVLATRIPPLKLLGQGQPHRFRGNNAAVTGMMELQFDRYREVAGLNRVSGLAGRADEALLLEQLRGTDEGLKISAAQRLAIFRWPGAAPALAACVEKGDREQRVAAALALAACGSRESVPKLAEALADPDPQAAQAAAVALENLAGHAEPFDPFAPLETRRQAVQSWRGWLQSNSWERIETDLAARLQGGDPVAARRAAVALGHIGGDTARQALRGYVTRESENNPYPVWRQNHQGDGALFNAASPANPRTLQAATRALGYLGDTAAIPLLAGTLARHRDPATANLFLAEACVEALGWIGGPEVEAALIQSFKRLPDYLEYTRWYGDHDALIACHASPVHYFITEALLRLGSTRSTEIVPHLIRSVPTDTDRSLQLANDDCETLIGAAIRQSGSEAPVVETCLAILGDPKAVKVSEIALAIGKTHQAWGGKPDPENRAAHILSLTCRNPRYEPRIRAALTRYQSAPVDIPRVFDTGIPVVTRLPIRHWVCFFLARSLGNLGEKASVEALLAALQTAPEAALGRPDPLGPGVLFLHNDLTPCWRAAVAWALGRIGDPRATPLLLEVVANLENAPDTRHAAALALGHLATPQTTAQMRSLAANYPEMSVRRALLQPGL